VKPDGDLGLFGPDSVAWRLHADPVMLVAAMRGLLVQALEPRAMAGVDQHSDYKQDPWRRLDRTVRFILGTTYGDTATAEQAVAAVRRIHQRVRGVDAVTGRPYSASDPDLILWIHAVETHSIVIAYRRYAGSVSDDDADRYVVEMSRVAELVGLPAGMAPRSMGELREYLRGMHDQLQLTPAARDAMRMIFNPPMPLPLLPVRALWAIPSAAAIAILPRVARRAYGLPWPHPVTPSVRAAVFALTRFLNLLPIESPEIRAARLRLRAA
jgi:uncharacterized protein (DUF2236 family)